jgi:TonB family protein
MNALLREMRGSFFRTMDPRFVTVMLVSLFFHAGAIWYLNHIKIPVQQSMDIEKVSERFARLIIEKPIPKTAARQTKKKTTAAESAVKTTAAPAEAKTSGEAVAPPKFTAAERTQARRVVAARAARVERMMRSVGVLGMLSGKGSTARGPAVVDVLSSMGDRGESSGSLDDALSKMSGLRKAENPEVLGSTLVKSKDVAIEHKQEIEDLITTMTAAKSVDLVKRGEFIIQKPESIEGSASTNAKRDNTAINAVVGTHKTSLRMSYENHLKRNPSLSGKITVRFTISAAGSVSSVTILENTTGNTDLEQEIKNKIRNWRFEAIDEGDVTVTYPFVFAPAAG